jgi:transcriptional regulator with XRE-family HTH domain
MEDSIQRTIQDRFRHYLKAYRRREKLTQEQLGTQLGYNASHIRKLEGFGLNNRLIHGIDFLTKLAELEGLELIPFLKSLLPKPSDPESYVLKVWQKELLELFEEFGMEMRREFLHDYAHQLQKAGKQDQIKENMLLAMKISRLDPESQAALSTLVQTLTQKRPELSSPTLNQK